MGRRVTIDAGSVPRLAAHVRLRYDRTRRSWVLLAPERVLIPDDTALEVLQRLDGESSLLQIAEALAVEYDAGAREIAADAAAMLQDLADKGFVRT